MSDVVALAKPRITMTVLLTLVGGLYMALPRVSLPTLFWLLLGTSLVVGGANALNMYIERDIDGRMTRTCSRPLPTGRMAPWVALALGLSWTLLSLPILWFGVQPLTAWLAAFANASYVLLYTPLKQRTSWAVVVGAVPGAMPPLLGWTAATGRLDPGGISLFLILLVWQIPHFHAIALFRRDEYARAGLHVLPVTRGIAATKRSIVLWTALLVAVTLVPSALSMVHAAYLPIACVLGGVLLGRAWAGSSAQDDNLWAKRFFLLSIPYLLLIFAVLLLTRRGA